MTNIILEIRDLHVAVKGTKILKGINLIINAGEVHVIMGPNGAGKSTLAKVVAGDATYEVTKGDVLFRGRNILDVDVEKRAHLGLFIGFQYPVEIPGVTNHQFLQASCNAVRESRGMTRLSDEEFLCYLDEKMALVAMKKEYAQRNVNEGFSGGEKKRNEIVQMAVLDPVMAILDETDSGLDVDAMRIVSEGVNAMRSPEKSLLLVTHYQRLLRYITPDVVHVMIDGVMVKSGGAQLAQELEDNGFDRMTKKGMFV